MNKKRGFTLVEVLVVVTIVAIISASVLGLMSGFSTKSAIAMTYATEKQLTNQFNDYCRGHDGLMPDGFDSLMRDDYATFKSTFSAAFTTDPTTGQLLLTTPSTMTRGFIYTGYDVSPEDGYPDANVLSKGVTVLACGSGVQTLTVAQLRASDVAALNQLGITYVYHIVHNVDMVNGQLTRVKHTLAVGDCVMALDPAKGFGTVPTYATINNFSSVQNLYLVFGIGPNCTIKGDRLGGLQEPPICQTIVTSTTDKPKPRTDYYNYYMVVVKIPVDPMAKPCFAGILDSQGWNSQGGEQWYNRFPD